MKKRKVALYSPYLNTLGGGEKYILSILQVYEKEGYEIYVFWDEDISQTIHKRLDIHFSHLHFLPNIFKQQGSVLQKMIYLKQFDTFLYVTDGSYFFSLAKQNLIYAMVPDDSIYSMNFVNRLKLFNYRFITHSQFTHHYLQELAINSQIIYPYLNDDFINQPINRSKQPIILAVGRFFQHLHAKRQDMMIKIFKHLKETNHAFNEFQLVLAGGLMNEDKSYFEELQHLAGSDKSITFKPNISYNELLDLYDQSLFFWHFAGYEIDDSEHPEKVEHLGLTPLEAMARACIVFCYKAGGPKEIVQQKINGYLFSSEKELITQMQEVLNNNQLKLSLQSSAHQFVKEHFSFEVFQKNVKKILQLK